ncbi:MAG: helix-turn-helix domain-containing protein [Treponema sp.]
MDVNNISKRLTELRLLIGLNQTKFAKELDTPRTTVIGYEAGNSIPADFLAKLHEKFNINIDWLLFGKGNPIPLSIKPLTAQDVVNQTITEIARRNNKVLVNTEEDHPPNELKTKLFDGKALSTKNTETAETGKEPISSKRLETLPHHAKFFPPKPPAETSSNEAEQEGTTHRNNLKSQLHFAQFFHSKEPAATPVKEAVSGSIEALAREAVAPALTAIEEKITDTVTTLATHTTQSETVLAAHTAALAEQKEQLNEISAALRKLQELSGQPLEDMIHAHTPLYTVAPRIRTVTELEPTYTARTEEDDEELPTTRLPLIENLAAGVPREMVDTYETYPVPTSYLKAHKTYFVAKIHGTSMTEAGIADGCYVLLEAKDVPESGDIVIARYENQTTLKRLKQRDDGRWELLYEDGSRAKIELIDPDWAIQAKFIRVV